MRLVILACIAACGNDASDLLSASRVSLHELASTRIHVDAPPASVLLPTIEGLSFAMQDEAGGTALDIFASCNAAHGADATLTVPIGDSRNVQRTEELLVTVDDNGSNACLAEFEIWDEPCNGASCDDACGAPPAGVQPTILMFAIGESHRICTRSTAVDTTRPLEDVTVELMPAVSAFELKPLVDDKLALVVRGQPWLVGPFTLTLTTRVGATQIVHSVGVQFGMLGDIGIEIGPASLATQFARSTIDVHVHHFDEGVDCAFGLAAFDPQAFRARLVDEAGASVDASTGALDCSATHPRYTLSLVPGIAAKGNLDVTFKAKATNTASADLPLKVQQRADDMTACGVTMSAQSEIACADLVGDGTLVVARTALSASCVNEVGAEWNAGPNATNGTMVRNVFAVPTAGLPKIYGIDSSYNVLELGGTHGAWQWQATTLPSLGQRAVAFRRSLSAGPPDTLASLLGGASPKLRFAALDGVMLNGDASLPDPAAIGIGVIKLATGPGIVIVSSTPSSSYAVAVYRVTLAAMTAPVLTLVASGMIGSMPIDATTIEIAGRGVAPQDLVMAFYSSEFASAVTESQISGSSVVLLRNYGAVGSVAATPEATVLLGAATGSVESKGNGAATYTLIDPVLPTSPSGTYGHAIAPCLDASGAMVGFAERTETGARVAKRDIVPEDP